MTYQMFILSVLDMATSQIFYTHSVTVNHQNHEKNYSSFPFQFNLILEFQFQIFLTLILMNLKFPKIAKTLGGAGFDLNYINRTT
jgi:hypothetical protein